MSSNGNYQQLSDHGCLTALQCTFPNVLSLIGCQTLSALEPTFTSSWPNFAAINDEVVLPHCHDLACSCLAYGFCRLTHGC